MNASGDRRKGHASSDVKSKPSAPKQPSMFPNPMVDIDLLRDYINGNGNNIGQLADSRFISPGQVMQKITTTARAICSYLNEDIDPEMFSDIYKHRKFFDRSIIDYQEHKDFNDPDKFEQTILKGFDLLSPARKMMLLEAMEARLFDNKHVA
jgi:hypothetical protein